MTMKTPGQVAALACFLLWLSGCSDPDDVPESHISAPPEARSATSALTDIDRFPLRTALFGDLHVHTSWSVDAYSGGNRLGPNSAYRFARGEVVELQSGSEAQLQTPLDFVALTDHAEGFGTHLACTIAGAPEFDTPQCKGHPIRRPCTGGHAQAGLRDGHPPAGAAQPDSVCGH